MLYKWDILTEREKKGVVRESYGPNFYSLLRRCLRQRNQLKRLIGQDQFV